MLFFRLVVGIAGKEVIKINFCGIQRTQERFEARSTP